MPLTTTTKYLIAQEALLGITFVPTVVLFFCSLCLARKRQDPARVCFTWLKVAFLVFTGAFFFNLVASGFSLAFGLLNAGTNGYYDASADPQILNQLSFTSNVIYAIFGLFDTFAELCIIIMLIFLGAGIGRADTGDEPSIYKGLKAVTYGLCALIGALAIADFGLSIYVYDSIFTRSIYDYPWDIWTSERRLSLVIYVLLMIIALMIVARSAMVVGESKKATSRVSNAAVYLMVCATLFLLRTTFDVASYASVGNFDDARTDSGFPGYYIYILNVVLSVWPTLAILVVVFALGIKKSTGLWSTDQPFMRVNPGGPGMPPQQQTPYGYTYDNNNNNNAGPGGYQQVPVPQQYQQISPLQQQQPQQQAWHYYEPSTQTQQQQQQQQQPQQPPLDSATVPGPQQHETPAHVYEAPVSHR